MISAMLNEYKKDRTAKIIGVDLEGYPKPHDINRYIPDCLVKTPTSFIILEAETCESMDWLDTKCQLSAFYNYAREHNAKFHMIVPKSCKAKVDKRLSEWKISAEVWTAANF